MRFLETGMFCADARLKGPDGVENEANNLLGEKQNVSNAANCF